MRTLTYSVTYSVVTPESAERGDFAETGFEVEDRPIEVDGVETVAQAIARIVKSAIGHSQLEPSSSGIDATTWFTECDGDLDYNTGAETCRSVHIDGATADEMCAAWELLK
jgi:hypothetical protein